MVTKTIDAILSQSSAQPIIIVQGDHGPGMNFVWADINQSCLWERTGILNAYLLPEDNRDSLYPSITPANSFRLILDELFDANLELLEDKSYFTYYPLDGTTNIIDVSGMIEAKANCPIPK